MPGSTTWERNVSSAALGATSRGALTLAPTPPRQPAAARGFTTPSTPPFTSPSFAPGYHVDHSVPVHGHEAGGFAAAVRARTSARASPPSPMTSAEASSQTTVDNVALSSNRDGGGGDNYQAPLPSPSAPLSSSRWSDSYLLGREVLDCAPSAPARSSSSPRVDQPTDRRPTELRPGHPARSPRQGGRVGTRRGVREGFPVFPGCSFAHEGSADEGCSDGDVEEAAAMGSRGGVSQSQAAAAAEVAEHEGEQHAEVKETAVGKTDLHVTAKFVFFFF